MFTQEIRYSKPGPQAFQVPPGVKDDKITVICRGGSGGGGFHPANRGGGAGGGGGGGLSIKEFTDVEIGQIFFLYVGKAGPGATSSDPQPHGEDSWFHDSGVCKASGGTSCLGDSRIGGNGGGYDSPNIGDTTKYGGNGGDSLSDANGGADGGSSPSEDTDGNHAVDSTDNMEGTGTSAPAGGGDGGSGARGELAPDSPGFDAPLNSQVGGGGGGAGGGLNTPSTNGADGRDGEVIIRFEYEYKDDYDGGLGAGGGGGFASKSFSVEPGQVIPFHVGNRGVGRTEVKEISEYYEGWNDTYGHEKVDGESSWFMHPDLLNAAGGQSAENAQGGIGGGTPGTEKNVGQITNVGGQGGNNHLNYEEFWEDNIALPEISSLLWTYVFHGAGGSAGTLQGGGNAGQSSWQGAVGGRPVLRVDTPNPGAGGPGHSFSMGRGMTPGGGASSSPGVGLGRGRSGAVRIKGTRIAKPLRIRRGQGGGKLEPLPGTPGGGPIRPPFDPKDPWTPPGSPPVTKPVPLVGCQCLEYTTRLWGTLTGIGQGTPGTGYFDPVTGWQFAPETISIEKCTEPCNHLASWTWLGTFPKANGVYPLRRLTLEEAGGYNAWGWRSDWNAVDGNPTHPSNRVGGAIQLEFMNRVDYGNGCDVPFVVIQQRTHYLTGWSIFPLECDSGENFIWSGNPYSVIFHYGTKEETYYYEDGDWGASQYYNGYISSLWGMPGTPISNPGHQEGDYFYQGPVCGSVEDGAALVLGVRWPIVEVHPDTEPCVTQYTTSSPSEWNGLVGISVNKPPLNWLEGGAPFE